MAEKGIILIVSLVCVSFFAMISCADDSLISCTNGMDILVQQDVMPHIERLDKSREARYGRAGIRVSDHEWIIVIERLTAMIHNGFLAATCFLTESQVDVLFSGLDRSSVSTYETSIFQLCEELSVDSLLESLRNYQYVEHRYRTTSIYPFAFVLIYKHGELIKTACFHWPRFDFYGYPIKGTPESKAGYDRLLSLIQKLKLKDRIEDAKKNAGCAGMSNM